MNESSAAVRTVPKRMKISSRASTRATGKRFEKRIRVYLESLGFYVDQARASVRMIGPDKWISSRNDIFGCADLCAVHPYKPYTLFLQAHAGTHIGDRQKKLSKVPWHLPTQKVQIWTRDSKVGRVRVLICDGFNVVGPDDPDGDPPGTRWLSWQEFYFKIKDGHWPPEEVL